MRRSVWVLAIAACAGTAHVGHPVEPRVATAQRAVEAFFGEPLRPFALEVVPTHAAMEIAAARRWKTPGLPCFAVAMGTGSTLLLMEPGAWAKEACDHGRDGDAEVERIITHELVHVFHGQHRPDDPEMDRAEDAGWFVEGLATYASGQLTPARERQVAELVAAGKAPARLADAWTGAARYGVAGSLVRAIDRRIGRDRLRALLPLSTTAEILAAIEITEADLLASLRGGSPQPM